MGFSKSILSYGDCQELCDRALASDRGLKVKLEDKARAERFRFRLSNFRKLDRERNLTLYKQGDPLYGRSVYDELEFRTRQEGEAWSVQLIKIKERLSDMDIGEITEEEAAAV